jgi:hypothetical protein
MVSIHVLLILLFFIFELLAALSIAVPRVNLIAAGLTCFALSMLLG